MKYAHRPRRWLSRGACASSLLVCAVGCGRPAAKDIAAEAGASGDQVRLATEPEPAPVEELTDTEQGPVVAPEGLWNVELDVAYAACELLPESTSPDSMQIRFVPNGDLLNIEVIGLGKLVGFTVPELRPAAAYALGHRLASGVEQTRYDFFDLQAERDGWHVAFAGTTTRLLGDIAMRCPFRAEGRAVADVEPPETTLAWPSSAVDAVGISFEEHIEADMLQVAVRGPDGESIAIDEAWNMAAARELLVSPRFVWPDGESTLEVTQLVDLAGNLSPPLRARFSVRWPAAVPALEDFEADAPPAWSEPCTTTHALDLLGAGAGPTVAAPEGERMLACELSCLSREPITWRWDPVQSRAGGRSLAFQLALFYGKMPAGFEIHVYSAQGARLAYQSPEAPPADFVEIALALTEDDLNQGFWLVFRHRAICPATFGGGAPVRLLLDHVRFEDAEP